MKRFAFFILLIVAACAAQLAVAVEPAKLVFDTYSGYFVSNRFETDAAESFVVLDSREQFDKAFGAAFVMRDKSHRLPKDAFKSLVVLGAIKRGKAVWEFKVESVTETDGVVTLKYTATSKKSDSATFASPLIASIPRGKYAEVQFVENGKPVKQIKLPAATDKKPAPAEEKPAAEKKGAAGPTKKDVATALGAAAFIIGMELLNNSTTVKVTLSEGKITAEPLTIKPANRVVFEVTNSGKEAHHFVVVVTDFGVDELPVENDRVRYYTYHDEPHRLQFRDRGGWTLIASRSVEYRPAKNFKEPGVKIEAGKTVEFREVYNYDSKFGPGTAFVLFCNEPKHYQNGERARIVVK
jgi:hypothetical protein